MRAVTERDFRQPEFLDANPDDYEFRADGAIVRKDRWETGFRRIVSSAGFSSRDFEIDDVVATVDERLNRKTLVDQSVINAVSLLKGETVVTAEVHLRCTQALINFVEETIGMEVEASYVK